MFLPSTYDKVHEKCALFIKITLFFYKTQFCLLIKFQTSDMSFYKTPFLWLLETPALRAAFYEAYPPDSYRQSSSKEDNEWIPSSKKMLKYICCSPISFLDFLKLTLLRQKECWRELLWVFRDWLGPPGCVDMAALSAPNNWFHHRHIERSDITKNCFFSHLSRKGFT